MITIVQYSFLPSKTKISNAKFNNRTLESHLYPINLILPMIIYNSDNIPTFFSEIELILNYNYHFLSEDAIYCIRPLTHHKIL